MTAGMENTIMGNEAGKGLTQGVDQSSLELQWIYTNQILTGTCSIYGICRSLLLSGVLWV